MAYKDILINTLIASLYILALCYALVLFLGIEENFFFIILTISLTLSVVSSGVGIFIAIASFYILTLIKSPILGILVSPLYITIAVKSFRYWYVTPVILIAYLAHIYYPSLALFSIPFILLASTFLDPPDAVITSGVFSYSVLMTLFLLYPANLTVSSGTFLITTTVLPPLRPFDTSFEYILDILITSSSILLKFIKTSIFGNDALGLLQIFSFTVAGYMASKLSSLGDSKIRKILILPLSSIPIFFTYFIYSVSLNSAEFEHFFSARFIYFFGETVMLSLVFGFSSKRSRSSTACLQSSYERKIIPECDPFKRMLEVIFLKTLRRKYKKIMLLIGPPGCGKTSLVKHVATSMNIDVYEIPEDDPLSLIELLKHKNAKKNRNLILIREIQEKPKILDLISNDELNFSGKTILVATSSYPLRLSSLTNVENVFEEVIYVPPPDIPSIEKFLKDNFLKHGIYADFKQIAPLLKNYSYRQLSKVVNRLVEYCSLSSYYDACEIGPNEILSVINSIKPDLTPQIYNEIETFLLNFKKPIIRPELLKIHSYNDMAKS